MPRFKVNPEVELYYEDVGEGETVIFIPGLWSSSKQYELQLPYFNQRCRTIAYDPRATGKSSVVHSGHTVANYAADLRALILGLALKDVVLVGWSMGAMIIWDYFKQFGPENIKATVVVDQTASDFEWPDWPFGGFDLASLSQVSAGVQMDFANIVRGSIPQFFRNPPTEEQVARLVDDVTRVPASIASTIMFDQSVQDYRPVLSKVTVPTLLCFGVAGIGGEAGGKYMEQHLPDARLVIFENSGHAVPLEETDRFNEEVDKFISSLP